MRGSEKLLGETNHRKCLGVGAVWVLKSVKLLKEKEKEKLLGIFGKSKLAREKSR